MLSLSFFSYNDMKLRKWEFDGKSTNYHSGIINWLSYNQWQAIVAMAGARYEESYIYIYIHDLPYRVPARTVLPLTEDDCKNNTVYNTNNKDTVYNIDIVYNIYNIYIVLT